MKLSGEVTKQTRLLCDDQLFAEVSSRYENIEACARYMLSKYGNLASDAALLRNKSALADAIIKEEAKSPCVTIRDLAIGGNDLLSVGIEPKLLGKIMLSLLTSVIEEPSLNEKETLIGAALKLTYDERRM